MLVIVESCGDQIAVGERGGDKGRGKIRQHAKQNGHVHRCQYRSGRPTFEICLYFSPFPRTTKGTRTGRASSSSHDYRQTHMFVSKLWGAQSFMVSGDYHWRRRLVNRDIAMYLPCERHVCAVSRSRKCKNKKRREVESMALLRQLF